MAYTTGIIKIKLQLHYGSRSLKSITLKILIFLVSIAGWNLAYSEEKPAADVEKIDVSKLDYLRVETCILCHEDQYRAMKASAHWVTGDERTPVNHFECATCHGSLEEHVLSAAKQFEGVVTYTKTSKWLPEEQNDVCETCHARSKQVHWPGSAHDTANTGCVGCHRMHQEDKVRSRTRQTEVCFSCHTEMRSQAHKPYGHPLNDQKMICSDCHGPHGGPGDADLKTFTVNETCYSCHAEKRGPFLWEHIPATENCVLCHSPHGSINKGMLIKRPPHLCQSCHGPILAGGGGNHQRHARLALSYGIPNNPEQAGGRGISRLVMGESCLNCHLKVHGSNHPAGAKLTR